MNRLLNMICCFLLSSALCGGQEKVSIITFDHTEWDFGNAREDGPLLEHDFSFVNTGTAPFAVVEVATYCRCTKAVFPRDAVAPGKEGVVKIIFDPYGYQGPISKGVTVITDRGDNVKLTFDVELTPRVTPVEEEYPDLFSPGLRIEKTELNYALVKSGEYKSLELRVVNVSEEELSLSLAFQDPAQRDRVSFVCPEKISPGEKKDIAITYGPTSQVGIFSDTLTFSVGSSSFLRSIFSSETDIPVVLKAAVAEDFKENSGGGGYPVAYIASSYFNYGKLPSSSQTVSTTFTLYNRGSDTLIVRDIHCPEGLSSSLAVNTEVSSGAKIDFTVTIDPKAFPQGSVFEIIKILFNDPEKPVRDLMLAAKIIQ